MKKILAIFGILLLSGVSVFAKCEYSGDPLDNFRECSPENAIQSGSDPNLDVTKDEKDFITLTKKIVQKIQIIAFFIAVGIIVWLGLMMVLPGNAEAKESTKSKLISVLLGFLAMIAATIIVNGVINIIYEVFNK